MPCTSSAFNKELSLLTYKEMPKGDLYVRFEIVFPEHLDKNYRSQIQSALEKNENETKTN